MLEVFLGAEDQPTGVGVQSVGPDDDVEGASGAAAEVHLDTDAASQDLADRIAHFAGTGLLDTDNPRLAAAHFSALTILLAYERQPIPATADPEEVRQTMADGAHAFIRAYATRSVPARGRSR
ncbi:TetR/AcrR family transcriptional regulator C-terminal domain-containing protein [Streptomyces sp. NPDC056468]|uniref:TetR/AcrR family transcriptional regulator C-terminal domain-containing protein n=1 Tax=Streptomyces sp. NPDC056468 TaxID=3345830 RepID=UPI0036CD004B